MDFKQVVDKALKNGEKPRRAGQFAPSGDINPEFVVALLVGAAAGGRHASIQIRACALLELMARGSWRVTAGVHKGGWGGRHGSADKTPHITVRVRTTNYHLRINHSGHLFQITPTPPSPRRTPETKLPQPWHGPGQPIT